MLIIINLHRRFVDMKRNRALTYITIAALLFNMNVVGFAEKQTPMSSNIKVQTQSMEKEIYQDGKFPGFSSDFMIINKSEKQRAGSMIVLVVKDGKIESMRTRYLNGSALKKEQYPEYLKAYETQIIEQGLEKVGKLKGHEEEGEIVKALVKDALERSKGYQEEFASRYQKLEKSEKLKDGTYLGKHHGFYPMEEFMVKVKVKDQMIDEVEILNSADDDYIRGEKYFGSGAFVKSLKGRTDANVDVVSGATFSSKGIQRAIENALQQARGYADNRFPGFSSDYKNEEIAPMKNGERSFERKGTFCLVRMKDGKIDSVSVRSVNGKMIDRKNPTKETAYIETLQNEIKAKGIENVQPVKGHEKESEQIIAAVVDALTRSAQYNKEFQSDLDANKKLKDGQYEGSHNGFYPMERFSVQLNIKDGKIDQLNILQHADDNYIRVDNNQKNDTAKRFKAMLESFKGRSDAKVDVVTGATFSSKGIQKAVEEALKKAQQ